MSYWLSDFLMTYPNISNCAIQYFTDGNLKRKAWILHMSDVDLDKLRFLNSENMGIFFSVNSMEYGKRNQKSMTHLNAWIAECDDLNKEEQMALIESAPLEPSCVIESKNSYHIYYFCKDAKKINWKNICNWLADYYNWDRKIIDMSRVLRLPWFYHCKDSHSRFLVECIHLKELYYTDKDMSLNFPYTRKKENVPTNKKQRRKNISWDNIWEKLSSLSNYRMLLMLSWRPIVSCEAITFKNNWNGTRQIYIWDRPTSCRIDKNDMIWSYDHWWPTRIQWVMRYGKVTKSELLKWALSEINI